MHDIQTQSAPCKPLPIRADQFDVSGFVAWLARNGAEIGIPTNMYEVVRYRAYVDGSSKPSAHIVYRKENGLLTWRGETQAHYTQFLTGAALWPSAPHDPNRPFLVTYPTKAAQDRLSKNGITRSALRQRDGDHCWFCGDPMGEDCTIEHLVPKSDRGPNSLANYALAHQKCNAAAANMPLVDKIEMRARLRSPFAVFAK